MSAPAASSAPALRVLGTYLLPMWPRVLLLAALLIGSVLLTLTLPQLIARFVDTATAALGKNGAGLSALPSLTRLSLSYIGVALVVQLLSAGATYLGAIIGWSATNRLRSDLLAHLLSLDMSYHKERTPGEMIERIDGDVTALSNFFSQFAVRVFGAALLLTGSVVMFFREEAWLGLGVLAFVALTLYGMNHVRRRGIEPTRHEREGSAKLFGFIEERLSGLDDVRSLGGGEYTLRKFLGVQRGYFQRLMTAGVERTAVWQFSMLMFTLGYVGVIGAAVGLYGSGAITIGTALLLYQYMSMVEEPIDQLTQQLQDVQKAGASLLRVGEILSLTSALPSGTQHLPAGALSLEFEDVSFAYEGEDDARVLSHLTFTLGAGRTLGLLGRTGSGKSTLTRLVSRLYDPTSGRVKLGGVSTVDADLTSLRSRIAVVTQDVQLFQASVRDNLTFFDAHIPDERVREALAEVGLLGWAESLPEGLSTRLPAGSLSAGEAQLLAFARVMLQDPGVILLDEPSSRLDPATEARLTAAMQRLLTSRSAVVIAHRLDTVARADDILVLGAGKVLEFGTREQLARDPNSQYAKLLAAAQYSELDDLPADLAAEIREVLA
ncbi:ABC transporter ATP-binding protein [Deinococcus psychrotolerans]|uniref:ABC transporter ATP-binding protein n=1 Tax=Deinococcus psychrotolerans TaxID=2489213 RepID=A0A3G8YE98_9DEIO|nr:ABC transporter ATP-binding protein [Deinococcus psychrotolerans]AZI43295.1 ABC transporter ATP-binding protein [Deinococcus psychrotolerans]